MRRGLLITVFVVAAALAAVPRALALLAETPVAATSRNEFKPAADFHSSGDELISYSRSLSGHPNRYDAVLRWVSTGGTTTIKLNARGRGYGGGIDSPRVIYQQVVNGNSNVLIYNIDDATRAAPPGVNTSDWEWQPTISGDWVLFGRGDLSEPTERVILHNVASPEDRPLTKITRRAYAAIPGQVNGNWAVYMRCAPVCNVIRYDILNNTRTVLQKPVTSPPRYQYAAGVTPAGVVYVARSGPKCGSNAKVVRYFGASDLATGTVVAALPRGIDIFNIYARDNGDGSIDVFYDRVSCSAGHWNVYKVTDGP
jgi:hypothetical protein